MSFFETFAKNLERPVEIGVTGGRISSKKSLKAPEQACFKLSFFLDEAAEFVKYIFRRKIFNVQYDFFEPTTNSTNLVS